MKVFDVSDLEKRVALEIKSKEDARKMVWLQNIYQFEMGITSLAKDNLVRNESEEVYYQMFCKQFKNAGMYDPGFLIEQIHMIFGISLKDAQTFTRIEEEMMAELGLM